MTRTDAVLTARPAGTVPEEATVRHVDQLSDAARDALRAMVDGGHERAPGLEPGEVVVSTRYYRVVAVDRETATDEACAGSTA